MMLFSQNSDGDITGNVIFRIPNWIGKALGMGSGAGVGYRKWGLGSGVLGLVRVRAVGIVDGGLQLEVAHEVRATLTRGAERG